MKPGVLRTPFSIPEEMQRDLCVQAMELGGGGVGVDAPARPGNFWRSLLLRDIDPTSLAPAQFELLKRRPEYYGDFCHFARLDPRLRWRWRKNPLAAPVERLLEPLQAFFERLTRVAVFVQIPGEEIPVHRDLVPGNPYDEMLNPYSALRGEQSGMIYLGKEWYAEAGNVAPSALHARQGHWALKIPLTCDPSVPAPSFLAGPGGHKESYITGNRIYFLDESRFHGAGPTGVFRGVIFADGILHPDRIAELEGAHST